MYGKDNFECKLILPLAKKSADNYFGELLLEGSIFKI